MSEEKCGRCGYMHKYISDDECRKDNQSIVEWCARAKKAEEELAKEREAIREQNSRTVEFLNALDDQYKPRQGFAKLGENPDDPQFSPRRSNLPLALSGVQGLVRRLKVSLEAVMLDLEASRKSELGAFKEADEANKKLTRMTERTNGVYSIRAISRGDYHEFEMKKIESEVKL